MITLSTRSIVSRLQKEFRRCGQFALGIALDMYPIMTCDPDEAPNLYQAKVSQAPSVQSVSQLQSVNLDEVIKTLVIKTVTGSASSWPSTENQSSKLTTG